MTMYELCLQRGGVVTHPVVGNGGAEQHGQQCKH